MMLTTNMCWITKCIFKNIFSMFLFNFLGIIYRSIFQEIILIIYKQDSKVKNFLTSSMKIIFRTLFVVSKRSCSGSFSLIEKSFLKLKKKLFKNILLHDKKQKQLNFKKQILNKFLTSGDADQTKMANFILLQSETCQQVFLNSQTLQQKTLEQETLQPETLEQETLQQKTLEQETLQQKTLHSDIYLFNSFQKETLQKVENKQIYLIKCNIQAFISMFCNKILAGSITLVNILWSISKMFCIRTYKLFTEHFIQIWLYSKRFILEVIKLSKEDITEQKFSSKDLGVTSQQTQESFQPTVFSNLQYFLNQRVIQPDNFSYKQYNSHQLCVQKSTVQQAIAQQTTAQQATVHKSTFNQATFLPKTRKQSCSQSLISYKLITNNYQNLKLYSKKITDDIIEESKEKTIEQPYVFSDDVLQKEDLYQEDLKTEISQVSQQKKIHEEQRFEVKKKQKFFTKECKNSALKNWFLLNISDPYPSETIKMELALRCNMSTIQVSNWFKKARMRGFSEKSLKSSLKKD